MEQVKVLFVCLGNICRSPMAESVFKQYVEDHGQADLFQIDSAGTAGYHIGEWPDERTLNVLEDHQIRHRSRAQQLKSDDFYTYDYILAMDHSNLADILELKPSDAKAEVKLFRDYDPNPGDKIVPDPYYGSSQDFKQVFDIISRSTESLFEKIKP